MALKSKHSLGTISDIILHFHLKTFILVRYGRIICLDVKLGKFLYMQLAFYNTANLIIAI